jgi:hypothetical protein
MLQVARNVTDAVDGALLGKRYLILDRDAKYSASFRRHIEESRIEVIRLPPRSPSKRVCGALRALDHRGLPEQDDLYWSGVTALCRIRVRRPLPR